MPPTTAPSLGSKQHSSAPSVSKPDKPTWSARFSEGLGRQRRRRASDIRRLQHKLLFTASDEEGSLQSLSKEVIWEQKLMATLTREKQVREQDLTRPDVVAKKLLELSAKLDADVSILANLTAAQGCLLQLEPEEFKARVNAVAQGLDISFQEALALAARDPPLLTRPAKTLQASLARMAALFKSRGMPPLPTLAAERPDLLRYNPATLATKIDALSMALGGVPYKVVRNMVSASPSLLRRSSHAVNARHENLIRLMAGLPRAYITELVMSAPALLEMSPALLQAKFNTLYNKYGAFRDDVVDVVLVDPQGLLDAPPTWQLPGPRTTTTTSRSSRRRSSSSGSQSSASPSSSPPRAADTVAAQQHSAQTDGKAAAARQRSSGTPGTTAGADVSGRIGSKVVEQQAELSASSMSSSSQGGSSQGGSSISSSQGGNAVSAVEVLQRWAVQVGVPLYDALQLYASGPQGLHRSVSESGSRSPQACRNALTLPGKSLGEPMRLVALPYRLDALSNVLGISTEQAKQMAGRAPFILTLKTSDLRKRLSALSVLVASSNGSGSAAAGRQQQQTVSDALLQLLLRQPELLLQSEGEVQARVEVLQARLGMRPKQLMALLMSKPRALLLSPQQLDRQLQDLSAALGGISASVMGELVAREAGLLEAATQQVAERFAEISSSFGSFNSDALGVVLADPSILLRQQQLGSNGRAVAGGRKPGTSPAVGAGQGGQAGGGAATARGGSGRGSGSAQRGGNTAKGTQSQGASSAQLVAADALDAMLQAEEKARQENQARNTQRRRQRKQSQQQEQQEQQQ